MQTPAPFKSLALSLLAALMLPLQAGGFTLSEAPVVNDPHLTQRDTAKLWPHVSIEEARRLFHRKGVLFLDGRSPDEWDHAHIPGAILLSPADFENSYPMVKSRLIHAKVLLCYCHGYSCGVADYLAQLLADKGLRNMAVFSGGFPAWQRAGYPLEGKDYPKKKSKIRALDPGR